MPAKAKATAVKAKRKVSKATLARLKELRRVNQIGEFRPKVSRTLEEPKAPRERRVKSLSPTFPGGSLGF